MKIVFVHFGREIPNYLIKNFLSFESRFPSLEAVLIVNKDCNVPKILKSSNLHFDDTSNRDHMFENTGHDPKFRNKFWRKSIERLIAVCEYQRDNTESKVLHFESDILILPNFPFSKFSSINSLLWQNYNQDRDVGSILFIPSKSAGLWLHDKLLSLVVENRFMTDMVALRRIRNEFPDMCGLIPSFPNGLQSVLNQDYIHVPTAYSFQDFGEGIFDSAQIGMWLTGMDPRNTYGVLRIHNRTIIENGEAPFDPSKLDFEIDLKGNLYAIPKKAAKLPIYSLHIHSKNPKIFDNNNRIELSNFIKLANSKKGEIQRFELSVVIKMLQESIRSGNLLNFVKGIPLIYKARLKIRGVLNSS